MLKPAEQSLRATYGTVQGVGPSQTRFLSGYKCCKAGEPDDAVLL